MFPLPLPRLEPGEGNPATQQRIEATGKAWGHVGEFPGQPAKWRPTRLAPAVRNNTVLRVAWATTPGPTRPDQRRNQPRMAPPVPMAAMVATIGPRPGCWLRWAAAN